MSRRVWALVRVLGPMATLAVVVWRLGTGPFIDGLRTVDAGALAAAGALTVITTMCAAWRWKLVAGGLGVELSLPAAVAAYYRAMFLNVTLPGGIVGDVHRAVSHGREVRKLGRAVRSVAWERAAGQVVQALLTLVVLFLLPSPVRSSMPLVAGVGVITALGLAVAARVRGGGRWAQIRRTVIGDVHDVLLGRRVWLGIVLTSALAVIGHALTFLLAARTAGIAAPPAQMLPIALLVMTAMVLPSVGGWGPREGVTAWAFGAAGLGAQRGVAAAVVYGVMVLGASLPGAGVLVVTWLRGARLRQRSDARSRRPAHA